MAGRKRKRRRKRSWRSDGVPGLVAGNMVLGLLAFVGLSLPHLMKSVLV